MPELPEVESVRRSLLPKICHKKIVGVDIQTPSIVRNEQEFFCRQVLGREFRDIQRVGKLLIFVLDSKQYLLAHLKMTGKFIYTHKKETVSGGHSLTKIKKLDPKHTHVIFTFADESTLLFHDVRKFGYLEIVEEQKKEQVVSRFGIEPLAPSFTLQAFEKIFVNRKTCIKAVLLDQKSIAGVGNIYADEICFASGVLPSRTASTLTKPEKQKLFAAAEDIIAKAIEKRGTTFHDYVDGMGNTGSYLEFLQVYNRGGQECLRCQGMILKIRVAGRGTHICKNCQK